MKRKFLSDLAHVAMLVLVPGVMAWTCGRPFIFPSLGPSAFALVFDESENRIRRVVGGHFIGVLGGLVAHHLLAQGLSLVALSPAFSIDGLRTMASGVTSVVLLTAGMLAPRATHAPACATTLIVSLGVLPGLVDGALIMVAVAAMFLTHRLVMLLRKCPDRQPVERG